LVYIEKLGVLNNFMESLPQGFDRYGQTGERFIKKNNRGGYVPTTRI
jgi:hypothetical protein